MLLEVALLLPLLLYAWHWWARGYWKRKNVFQIDGEFFFGSTGRALLNNLDFFKTFYNDIYRDHKKKKLIGFYNFYKPMLVVTDLDYIKQVFITDYNSFPMAGFGLGSVDKLFKCSSFLFWGDQWKNCRGIQAQALSPAKLKEYLPLLIKSGQSMNHYIKKNIQRPIKVVDLMRLYTIDNITSAIYGLEPTAFVDPENGFRKHATETIFDEKMNITWQLANYLPTICALLQFRFFSKKTEDFFLDIAAKTFEFRRKNNLHKNDLIDQLIKINQKRLSEGKKGMEVEEIASHMMTLYLDSVDTSSSVLSFVFLELANRVDIQEKLRAEILAAGKEPGDFDIDKIHSLEYLSMVFSEIFRIHSVMMYFTRICVQDTKLGSVKIEKGTKLIIPLNAILNDPDYFPEPEKFIPERFLPDNQSNLKGKFFPFGEGPKQCLGMRYATLQIKLAVIVLLLKYRLIPAKKSAGDKVGYSTKPDVFCRPDNDEHLIFEEL